MFFTDLETERLFLKNISKDDRDFIFDLFSSENVTEYLFDAEPLTNISGADEIIDSYLESEPRDKHRWIIVRKIDNVKMGTCGFHCWNYKTSRVDIGYDLRNDFWGYGYMQEAIKEIIKFAINQMNIIEINACIYIDNHRSIRLVEKCNFIENGFRNEVFRGKAYSHKIYTKFCKDN